MVQGKLQTLPKPLQRSLIFAAYTTPTVIELTLLQVLLPGMHRMPQRQQPQEPQSFSSYYSLQALQQCMQQAFHEGLVLYAASTTSSSPHHPQQQEQEKQQQSKNKPDDRAVSRIAT
ncbi:hypothetical protein ACA910_012420 [Epithemia clementina (nom. ined.)]